MNSEILYLINKCNSNCIICPDPEKLRQVNHNIDLVDTYEKIDNMDSETRVITITGGEPTLLKNELPVMIQRIQEKLPETHIILLSNGRAFANQTYTDLFSIIDNKKFSVEIPIHDFDPAAHDSITQSPGSFHQSVSGIKRLINMRIPVTIRLVVTKKNYLSLSTIVKKIIAEAPQISGINIMGMEILGSAYQHINELWVDFDEVKDSVSEAAISSFMAGVKPKLYNFPLCMFERRLWTFYEKSITSNKIRYFQLCDDCLVKNRCGGFFYSTMKHTKFKVKNILVK